MKKILIILVLIGLLLMPSGVYAKTMVPINAKEKSISIGGPTTTTTAIYVGDNFCNREGPKKIFRIAGYMIALCQFAAPIVVAVVGIFDMFKAVTDGKAETISKQGKLWLKRLAIALIIAFTPTIIYAFIKFVNPDSVKGADNCYACLMEPTKCNI